MRPRILVTGAHGQIGYELARLLDPHGEVIAADRERLDLSKPDAIVAAVRGTKPALIVNAGCVYGGRSGRVGRSTSRGR
jgi:dTDP-4-dehydrorhamnose reductase